MTRKPSNTNEPTVWETLKAFERLAIEIGFDIAGADAPFLFAAAYGADNEQDYYVGG